MHVKTLKNSFSTRRRLLKMSHQDSFSTGRYPYKINELAYRSTLWIIHTKLSIHNSSFEPSETQYDPNLQIR